MQTQKLTYCNRVAHPLCSSNFFGRRKFLKRALCSQHPSQNGQAKRTCRQSARCLIATGGSDDEDDEVDKQATPSSFQQAKSPASSGLGLNPDLEQPVPNEQRPVNELAALRETWLYSWVSCKPEPADTTDFCYPHTEAALMQARLETPSYLSRLGAVWLGFFALVAGPIAFQTFDPSKQVGCAH